LDWLHRLELYQNFTLQDVIRSGKKIPYFTGLQKIGTYLVTLYSAIP